MDVTQSLMERPTRWKEPFDPEMDAGNVQQILAIRPFATMDPSRFSKAVPLTGIIQNDCRLLELDQGDIIVCEGDYGNSAFLIISGEALVSLKSLPTELLGRVQSRRKNLFSSLAQLWSNDSYAEVRRYDQANSQISNRQDRQGTRVFLNDIPRILQPNETDSLNAGEVFGESSALTRTPRSATVIANGPMKLLEIRWQGLRDLMKGDPSFRNHVERVYRDHSLKAHLREVKLFSKLDAQHIDVIAKNTSFETYGKFQWNLDYRSTRQKDVSERILDEPAIINEGDYVNSLFLIRNGFVRICRNHGEGIQTVAYMGKGGIFGLREITHNWKTGEQRPWSLSLRAVGYVDVLRVPVGIVERHALRWLPDEDLPKLLTSTPEQKKESGSFERRRNNRKGEMERGLLEFLVEERFTNGTKAMMIDLNRCTRCDDCVRACASTHNNNPRFVRQGQIHDNWMITNACMHCIDPVCMIGCPTGAIARDSQTGNVTINDSTCIGCATCSNSCPYDNIRMVEINDPKGNPIVDAETREPIMKATKCDFCMDQLGGPACQRACPHDALARIDLTEPTEVSQWTQ